MKDHQSHKHIVPLLAEDTQGEGLSSLDYYSLGNKYRREGNWAEAINNYIAAIELDPDSPAVEAKQMLDEILGYYNKDMYNP